MNREIRKCFYDECLDDFYEYIEIKKIKLVRDNPKYLELHDKIINIKKNNAKIRKYIEDNEIETLSVDELSELLELIKANEDINVLYEKIIFKLGFKEACTILI